MGVILRLSGALLSVAGVLEIFAELINEDLGQRLEMRDMHLEFITIRNLEGGSSAYFVFDIVEESESEYSPLHQQQPNTHDVVVVVVSPRHLGDGDGRAVTLKTK